MANDSGGGTKKRSFFGMFCGFVLKFVLPITVVFLAIVIGWFNRFDAPEGAFFACVFPIAKGFWPPPIVGHGKMLGTSTIPVPDDYEAQPRPTNERLLPLPFDQQIPQVGLGMCCRASAYDDELVYRTVLWYLLSGGRHIDGAHLYLNHKAIGRGIREAMRRADIPREEIFVTTKLWTRDFGYNRTKELVPQFLEELDLEYIDLILMHAPSHFFPKLMSNDCTRRGITNAECRRETWLALSELREAGVMKNVGVSNFHVQHFQDLEALQTPQYNPDNKPVAPIAVNQFQFNPFSPDFAVDTYNYCQKNGIVVTAYASLGGAMNHISSSSLHTLESISAKHSTTITQIALRWAVQKNVVVIPGTGNPKHMRENLGVYDFSLTDEDMAALDNLRNDEMAKKFFYMEPLD